MVISIQFSELLSEILQRGTAQIRIFALLLAERTVGHRPVVVAGGYLGRIAQRQNLILERRIHFAATAEADAADEKHVAGENRGAVSEQIADRIAAVARREHRFDAAAVAEGQLLAVAQMERAGFGVVGVRGDRGREEAE